MKIKKLKSFPDGQEGFTLIELLVVIIIIAILAAIAIPVYLQQRQKSWDANSRSDLYNAAVAQVTYFGEFGVYTGNLDDLFARGYNKSDSITLTIRDSGATYCMEAFHSGDPARIWHADSGSGSPDPELGSC